MFFLTGIKAQWFISISVNLSTYFIVGSTAAWMTAAIPKLTASDAPNVLNGSQIGWVSSMLGIGAAVGPILTWLLVDRIGRKATMALGVAPMIISFVIIAVRTEYVFLLVARFLAGVGLGITQSTVPLYIGEISENKVRGTMGVLSSLMNSIGSLLPILVGPFVSLLLLNLICAVISFVLMFTLAVVPESPYFYVMKGKFDMATRSLRQMRKINDVNAELKTITDYVERTKSKSSGAFDVFTKGRNRRPFVILVLISFSQYFSGGLSLPTYAYTIFGDSGTGISLTLLVGIMQCVTVIASVFGIFNVGKLGRRPILFIGSSIMVLFLIVNGIFYTLKNQQYDVSSFTIVPFIGVIGYVIGNYCGTHSLAGIVLSEYFSTIVKAKIATLYAIIAALFTAASVKLFQMSYDGFGADTAFYICAGVLLLVTIILYFIMPETKGCSLQNIESMHSSKKCNTAATSDGVDPAYSSSLF